MQTQNSTLAILLNQFNGQVLVPFSAGAKCIAISPQTARNQLSQHKFPIPSFLAGSRRYIHIQDLADYVDSLRGQKEGSQ